MNKTIPIESQDGVIIARQAGREMAKAIGLGTADQTRLATAISEITRNVLIHGGGKGMCEMSGQYDNNQRQIEVVVEDHGPGIEDIDKAHGGRIYNPKKPGCGAAGDETFNGYIRNRIGTGAHGYHHDHDTPLIPTQGDPLRHSNTRFYLLIIKAVLKHWIFQTKGFLIREYFQPSK